MFLGQGTDAGLSFATFDKTCRTTQLYHTHMYSAPKDVAQIRLDNALVLFEEFVSATIKHPDAATLRGLERRFAERLQIQPSYWSQIKGRSRQIGERLARQFEQLCHKPLGWMDQEHGTARTATMQGGSTAPLPAAAPSAADTHPSMPQDDDERFIVGLVLTYYRRHPQRARGRLLDLLGEVLTPPAAPEPPAAAPPRKAPPTPGVRPAPATPPAPKSEVDEWRKLQQAVAPLKTKR
jgi:hypothetical protein